MLYQGNHDAVLHHHRSYQSIVTGVQLNSDITNCFKKTVCYIIVQLYTDAVSHVQLRIRGGGGEGDSKVLPQPYMYVLCGDVPSVPVPVY